MTQPKNQPEPKKEPIILTGSFFPYNEVNRNGRIYSEEACHEMVSQFNLRQLDSSMFGELQPDYNTAHKNANIAHPSHIIKEMHINKETCTLDGTIELLETPHGKVAQEIIKAGMPLSVASRGIGTIDSSGYVTLTKIFSYDLIPSPEAAFDSKLEYIKNRHEKGDNINIIIDDKMTYKSVESLSEIKDEELYEGLYVYVNETHMTYIFSQGMWNDILNMKDDVSTRISLDDL